MIPLEEVDETKRDREWMRIAAQHDAGLYRHSVFVSELTAIFTAYLGLSFADQRLLERAALLHDVGKTQVPRELLRKPTALTWLEKLEIEPHPEIGYFLLRGDPQYDEETLAVVRHHHERLDGSGYPAGLLATGISEPVRIVTICDIYAAMTEPRPYGAPLSSQDAIAVMEKKTTRLDQFLMKHFAAMAPTVIVPLRPWNWNRALPTGLFSERWPGL